MGAILSAEHLKMKRTMVQKLIFLAPVVTVLLGISAGSFFEVCSLNWWYTSFFTVLSAILCNQMQEKEKKKLGYRNVYMSPVSFDRIWLNKGILAALYGVFASVFFGICLFIVGNGLGYRLTIGIQELLLAGVLIPLLYLYQIPIYMFLAKRFSFIATFLFGFICIIGGFVGIEKTCWLFLPMTWCNRAMYTVLHIRANGLMVEQEEFVVSGSSIAICAGLSLLLFVIGMMLSGRLVENGDKRR